MNNINFHKLYKLLVEEYEICTKKQYNRFIYKFLLWFLFATTLILIPGVVVIGNILIPIALIICLIGLITTLESLREDPDNFKKLNKIFNFWPLIMILNIVVIVVLKYLNY